MTSETNAEQIAAWRTDAAEQYWPNDYWPNLLLDAYEAALVRAAEQNTEMEMLRLIAVEFETAAAFANLPSGGDHLARQLHKVDDAVRAWRKWQGSYD